MHNLVSEERVLAEVRKAVAETLRLEEGAVRAESSIVRDLGADSLDFLDIAYRLEQAFGIKMARRHFLEHVEELFGEGTAIDDAGRLTAKGAELVRIRYRELGLAELGEDLGIEDVPGLITVGTMAKAVADVLDTLPERCGCGRSAWQAADGAHVGCAACGEPGPYANGDELVREWLQRVQARTGLFATGVVGAG